MLYNDKGHDIISSKGKFKNYVSPFIKYCIVGYVCMLSCSVMSNLFATPCHCSPPDSVHGISQAKILKWVAIPFSREYSQPRDQTHVYCVSCRGRQIFFLPLSPLGSPIKGHTHTYKTWE